MDTRDELPGSNNSGPYRTGRLQPTGFPGQLGGHDTALVLAEWNTNRSVRPILEFQVDAGFQWRRHSGEWRLDRTYGSDYGDLIHQQLSNLHNQEFLGSARGASHCDQH